MDIDGVSSEDKRYNDVENRMFQSRVMTAEVLQGSALNNVEREEAWFENALRMKPVKVRLLQEMRLREVKIAGVKKEKNQGKMKKRASQKRRPREKRRHRSNRRLKRFRFVDEEAEEVPHSVSMAEDDVIRPERPGDVMDSVETEAVPEPVDCESRDPNLDPAHA